MSALRKPSTSPTPNAGHRWSFIKMLMESDAALSADAGRGAADGSGEGGSGGSAGKLPSTSAPKSSPGCVEGSGSAGLGGAAW